MADGITLKEALELVDFWQDPDGNWHVLCVKDGVIGSVGGNVGGNVWGTISGRHWKYIEDNS